MSEAQRNHKNTEDEIDLRQLFKAIGDFFKGIGRGIVNGIIGIRRKTIENRWLIGALGIVGIVLGVLFYNVSKPVYSSSMLLSSEYFNGRIVENSIEKLNLLCEEEDRTGLAAVLNVEPAVALNIVQFQTEPFISEEDRVEIEVLKQKLSEMDLEENEINKIIERIEIENKNTFQIMVNVNKSEIINGLQPAIVNFFRNNSYINNRIQDNEERLKDRLTKLEKEDKKLDSLKIAMINVYQSLSKKSSQGSDNLYIGEQYSANPIEIFSEDLRINREILTIKSKLVLSSDFEVIDGLTVFKKPQSASLKEAIIFGFLIGVALAYITIMLLSINRYLAKVEASNLA